MKSGHPVPSLIAGMHTLGARALHPAVLAHPTGKGVVVRVSRAERIESSERTEGSERIESPDRFECSNQALRAGPVEPIPAWRARSGQGR